MEVDADFLSIYDGGSNQAEMIAYLKGTMNGTKISIARNQMYVVLHTNGNNVSIRLNATIIKRKFNLICHICVITMLVFYFSLWLFGGHFIQKITQKVDFWLKNAHSIQKMDFWQGAQSIQDVYCNDTDTLMED